MALSDVASNLTEPGAAPWRTCGTCHALAGMSDADAAVLIDLLRNPNVRYNELADALEADPDSPTIDRAALSRHARGQCSAKERLR